MGTNLLALFPGGTPGQVVLGPALFIATAQFLPWSFFKVFPSSSSSKTCSLGIWELGSVSLFMGRCWVLERP